MTTPDVVSDRQPAHVLFTAWRGEARRGRAKASIPFLHNVDQIAGVNGVASARVLSVTRTKCHLPGRVSPPVNVMLRIGRDGQPISRPRHSLVTMHHFYQNILMVTVALCHCVTGPNSIERYINYCHSSFVEVMFSCNILNFIGFLQLWP